MMVACISCPATYDGSFAEAQSRDNWTLGPKCPKCSTPFGGTTRSIEDEKRRVEQRVDEAMHQATLIFFRGCASEDPYAMHRAVESIPKDVLRSIMELPPEITVDHGHR